MNLLLPFLFLGLLGLGPAPEVDVPRNDGWVTDLANVLSDREEAELEVLMESYKRGSTHEIALLTVPSLGGESVERYALEVARAWGMGGEQNNAALLVVSTGDRKLRIEVGRGLEGDLTDLLSGRIIREVMTPHFKNGDMARGVKAGVVAMHAAIGGDYGPIESSRGARRSRRGGGSSVMIAIMVLFFIVIGRRGGRGGGGSILPWLVLGSLSGSRHRGGGFHGGGFSGGGGGFSGFGGGGGFSGGGASGGW